MWRAFSPTSAGGHTPTIAASNRSTSSLMPPRVAKELFMAWTFVLYFVPRRDPHTISRLRTCSSPRKPKSHGDVRAPFVPHPITQDVILWPRPRDAPATSRFLHAFIAAACALASSTRRRSGAVDVSRVAADGDAMPRRRAPPRLYLDPGRKVWVIRDGPLFVRLGLPESEHAAAERRLRDYLAQKYEPERSNDPSIADCLILYAREHAPHTATAARSIGYLIKHLGEWWSTKRVSDVSPTACREYARDVGSASYARRCLETLAAAVRYYSKTKRIPLQLYLWLPPRAEPRARWLTRGEVARLLWAARRHEHLRRFIL